MSVFVFGSNLAGRHGKGAADEALRLHGAIYGLGSGPQGQSYAIPTKDCKLQPLPLATIKKYVEQFIEHARQNHHTDFTVTAIGTGLAGYEHSQIAPMFRRAPSNCYLPQEWRSWLIKHSA
jgi:hypothetical protein